MVAQDAPLGAWGTHPHLLGFVSLFLHDYLRSPRARAAAAASCRVGTSSRAMIADT